MEKNTAAKMKLLTAMFIFGSIGIIRKYIPYPSSVIALVRGFIGMLFLLVVMCCKKERISKEQIGKNLLLLCISGLFLGGNWMFLFEAYRYTSVSVATMCYYMAPMLVIMISPIVFKEPLTKKKGMCAVSAILGMILVSGILESEISGYKGILFGLTAAVMYAGVVILNKFISDISAGARTVFQLGAAAVTLFPYVLFTEDAAALDTDITVLLLLLLMGIVYTGIAYSLYFDSIKKIPAQTAALFSYIDPAVAVILSLVVLKEKLSASAVIGVLLVMGAAVVSELPDKKIKK